MPLALVFALAASLGAHAVALFLPDVDLSTAPTPPPLVAEIALPPAVVKTPVHLAPPPATHRRHPQAKAAPASAPRSAAVVVAPANEAALTVAPAVLDESAMADRAASDRTGEPTGAAPGRATGSAAVPSNWVLPAEGTIRYRVYRGTRGLEVGRAVHHWQIADGHYALDAMTETSGLAALFKPLKIELASRGEIDAGGFRPASFVIRRDGVETRERADFDWENATVRIGDHAPESVPPGAQDLLSFHYQLALLPLSDGASVLPIATGKKFERYRLETLGDEEIETPAGIFRTLHVRAPGDNTTELWLARDRWLLPVKIRHTDRHGDSFEQLVDRLETSSD
ncbi:DUF3108 domain-containing protein [Rhodocyclus gracilis]|uniref:DUF3108 domain-containing protein n=1 Tax=Rhodocyclus tenuis TaxID=1066 RepID=A0A6L5JWJ8_RHOTE|nr:DUF3108 domain-containing protein [Rhodocyclus gracilis]MQY51725.1 DUF3108 domain-containing protein [Rhodocyclus gracilis]